MKPPPLYFHEDSAIPEIGMAGNLEVPEAETPDARVFLMTPTGSAIAHAALWWNGTPDLEGKRIGAIGAFAASDGEAAKVLLDGAVRRLRETGCAVAVGPMNGNTWRRHRFVIESDGRKPFLLEPRNPMEHPQWWRQAGFEELSRYSSSLMELDGTSTISAALRNRLEKSGMEIRHLNPDVYDDELRMIHTVSLRAFSRNFLYTPLEEEAFLQAYRKVKAHVDADLVRIAERAGEPCGFVFGIPDLEAAARGEKPALIVKTLAVDPVSRCAGLGSWLVDELHGIARSKGYTEAIHALQHETNTSLKITGRHQGRVFRRYALFHQPL